MPVDKNMGPLEIGPLATPPCSGIAPLSVSEAMPAFPG